MRNQPHSDFNSEFQNHRSVKVSLYQTFVTAFIVLGIIAVCAVAFNYPGAISLKFGADGIQLEMDGGK